MCFQYLVVSVEVNSPFANLIRKAKKDEHLQVHILKMLDQDIDCNIEAEQNASDIDLEVEILIKQQIQTK